MFGAAENCENYFSQLYDILELLLKRTKRNQGCITPAKDNTLPQHFRDFSYINFLIPYDIFLAPYDTFLTPSDTFLTPSDTFLKPSVTFLTPSDNFQTSSYDTFLTPSGTILTGPWQHMTHLWHRLTPFWHHLKPSRLHLTPSSNHLTPSGHHLTPSWHHLTPSCFKCWQFLPVLIVCNCLNIHQLSCYTETVMTFCSCLNSLRWLVRFGPLFLNFNLMLDWLTTDFIQTMSKLKRAYDIVLKPS